MNLEVTNTGFEPQDKIWLFNTSTTVKEKTRILLESIVN